MGSFSILHWAIVLGIVVLVFGTGKIKHIGGDLGGAIRDFKRGVREGGDDPSGAQDLVAPRIQGIGGGSGSVRARGE
jgi:sec-independent protein translocase protein TatA